MSNIHYDTYYGKHCARYYGWLPASKEFKKLIKKDSLKYFTLCAIEAIDVFMLEQAGVLLRDKNRMLPDVIICESDKRVATEIFYLVRPPLKEAILIGDLKEILTFQDTEETEDLPPNEDVRDRRIRDLLKLKGLSERIKKHFPFDIINSDPYGNLLNPPFERNKLYESFSEIFELQKGIDNFLLFVTTPIFDIHPDTKSRLESEFESNASTHTDIHAALQSSFGTINYNEINERKRIAIGFSKSVVISIAKSKGWNHKHYGIFIYESPNRNKMLCSIVQFTKTNTIINEALYVHDIVNIINNMPNYYSSDSAKDIGEVVEHLEGIVNFRETHREEYLSD